MKAKIIIFIITIALSSFQRIIIIQFHFMIRANCYTTSYRPIDCHRHFVIGHSSIQTRHNNPRLPLLLCSFLHSKKNNNKRSSINTSVHTAAGAAPAFQTGTTFARSLYQSHYQNRKAYTRIHRKRSWFHDTFVCHMTHNAMDNNKEVVDSSNKHDPNQTDIKTESGSSMMNLHPSNSVNDINLPQQQNQQRLVIILAGPTASGKSNVGAILCQKLNGLVVSADSVQVYKDIQIGANKPTIEERNRTPHILIDIIDTKKITTDNDDDHHRSNDSSTSSKPYNAAEWRSDALLTIEQLLLLNKTNHDDDDMKKDSKNLNNSDVIINENDNNNNIIETKQRQNQIKTDIVNARIMKNYSEQQPLVPIVVGGTMMYLQWLVHGQPIDSLKPSILAHTNAELKIVTFQNHSDDGWNNAVQYVSSYGPTYQKQVSKLGGNDWYRLRRILEVVYTMQEKEESVLTTNDRSIIKKQKIDHNNNDTHDENNDDNDKQKEITTTTEKAIYTGLREGSLSSLGYDVRCFFLCPNDRMIHSKIIDERCETMIISGLLQETTNLLLSSSSSSNQDEIGHEVELISSSSSSSNNSSIISSSLISSIFPLPDMITKAIGYRQTIDYLCRPNPIMNDIDTFIQYITNFATLTRQYSKKQMQWFRRDPNFIFVPIPVAHNSVNNNMNDNHPNVVVINEDEDGQKTIEKTNNKSFVIQKNDDDDTQSDIDRITIVANEIIRMSLLSRNDYDQVLSSSSSNDKTSISFQTRQQNEEQGKSMKTYQYRIKSLKPNSIQLKSILDEADQCTKLIHEVIQKNIRDQQQ